MNGSAPKHASGETLNFRLPHEDGTAVVLISFEAVDDHFGIQPSETLLQAFHRHEAEILTKVSQKLRRGVRYTSEAPLCIGSGDLETTEPTAIQVHERDLTPEHRNDFNVGILVSIRGEPGLEVWRRPVSTVGSNHAPPAWRAQDNPLLVIVDDPHDKYTQARIAEWIRPVGE